MRTIDRRSRFVSPTRKGTLQIRRISLRDFQTFFLVPSSPYRTHLLPLTSHHPAISPTPFSFYINLTEKKHAHARTRTRRGSNFLRQPSANHERMSGVDEGWIFFMSPSSFPFHPTFHPSPCISLFQAFHTFFLDSLSSPITRDAWYALVFQHSVKEV